MRKKVFSVSKCNCSPGEIGKGVLKYEIFTGKETSSWSRTSWPLSLCFPQNWAEAKSWWAAGSWYIHSTWTLPSREGQSLVLRVQLLPIPVSASFTRGIAQDEAPDPALGQHLPVHLACHLKVGIQYKKSDYQALGLHRPVKFQTKCEGCNGDILSCELIKKENSTDKNRGWNGPGARLPRLFQCSHHTLALGKPLNFSVCPHP